MRELALVIVAEALRAQERAKGRRVISLEAIWRYAEYELFHMTECQECCP